MIPNLTISVERVLLDGKSLTTWIFDTSNASIVTVWSEVTGHDWPVSRDLLAEILHAEAGSEDPDVTIRPEGGAWQFKVNRAWLYRFLILIHQAVAPSEERKQQELHADRAAESLLSG